MITMSVNELSEIMKVQRKTIYQKIWKGTMPIKGIKSGRRILFMKRDVEQWLESLPRIPDDRKEVRDNEARIL